MSANHEAIEAGANSDSSDFEGILRPIATPMTTTLTFFDKSLVNIQVFSTSSSSEPQCLYYIHNSTWTPSTPHVTLHSGTDKAGAVLGVGKIGFSSAFKNTIGLGDPDARGGADVMWEELRRTSRWTHSRYEWTFPFPISIPSVDPKGGEELEPGLRRHQFTWQRTRRSLDDQPDLALFTSAEPQRMLARYTGHGLLERMKSKRRGTLEVSGGVGAGADAEVEEAWQRMVVLTAALIIESARKRARAAR
jgi:hypothetical protein